MSGSRSSRPRATRRVPEERPKGRLKAYALMLTCLIIMIAGFFLAARQHFASMDYGIKNSRLRRQLDELEAEKRRLMVAREVSLSPAEIRKAAKKLTLPNIDTEITAISAKPKDTRPTTQPAPALVKAIVSSAPVRTDVAGPSRPGLDKASRSTSPTRSSVADRSRIVTPQVASANTRRPAL